MLVRSQSVAPLLAYVRKSSHDPADLIQRFELPPEAESDLDFALSIDTLSGLFDAASALLNEPALGVKVALTLQRGRYGLLEYATFNAPTLKVALELLVQYSILINRAVQYELTPTPGGAHIHQRIPGRPDGLGQHSNEFNLVAMLQMGRAILNRLWAPDEVWFAHPAPSSLAVLEGVLGTKNLRFGAGSNGFAVSRALLEAQVSAADATLLELLKRYADAEVAKLPRDDSFGGRVQSELERLWRPGKAPGLEDLATTLKMSPRTLQRRLKGESLDFQLCLDRVREQMARKLLSSRPQLGELAFVLGYSDLGSFIRAYKRWTGTTPGKSLRAPAQK